ncbi:MAG TPA: GMC family oxidoreductase, partial [Paracoccaceae bacterium]|nr:GMC family oxidoreductase [Paracoccaceae bacterium]
MQDLGDWDYVIVGAGTAGCLLANRLSADPGTRVLLLEAGGSDSYHWIRIPVGYLYCIDNPRTDWRFRTEPVPGLGGRSILYPRGKVLGGCSSINGMIYMRGQRQDYDRWRQMGCTGWGWDDVLPHFIRHEDHWMGADYGGGVHGAGGEWRIEAPRVRWEVLDAFRDACEQTGIPKIEDFNAGDNSGAAYFHVTQRSGFRWNTARAFLRPARNRPNLRVVTKAQA